MRSPLRKSLAAIDVAKAQTAKARQGLAEAELREDAAKGLALKARLAGKRAMEILALFDFRFPDIATRADATRFAACYASAVSWEWSGMKDAASTVTKSVTMAFPQLSRIEISEVIAETGAMTARQVGDLLELTASERDLLHITMIKPVDRTDDELEAERKAKDAARQRASRPRSIEQRRADEYAQRRRLEMLAKSHGKSVRTIREWIKTGKLAKSAISHPDYIYTNSDATLQTSNLGLAVERDAQRAPSGRKAARRGRNSQASLKDEIAGVCLPASRFVFSEQEHRDRIASSLRRAASILRGHITVQSTDRDGFPRPSGRSPSRSNGHGAAG